jgi:hypothetical protein
MKLVAKYFGSQLGFGLSYRQTLTNKLEKARASLAEAKDAKAYAEAMHGYHTVQVTELVPVKQTSEHRRALLLQLEAEQGVAYAEMLCAYYTQRIKKLTDHLQTPAATTNI